MRHEVARVEMSDEVRGVAFFDAITRSVRKLVQVAPMAAAAVDVLEEICQAAHVQRGFLFENTESAAGGLSGIEVARWCDTGYEPQVSTLPRGHPYEQWRDCYGPLIDEQGVVAGPVDRVGPPERELLRHLGVRSVLAAPIFAGRRWWGYLGLHDCLEEREWSPLERRAIACAAAMFGAAAYERPPSQDEGALQRLVEHVPAILYIDDLEVRHRSIYVGPQIETILGIPRATWLEDDQGWERYMHPDDWPRVNESHEEWLQRGGSFVQVYRMIRPDDGRVVWIQDECTSYPGVDGSPGVIQGVMTDITEQKVLEEQLRAAEAKNRALIEQIPAVVYIEPLEGSSEERFVSASVETVFGVGREEWLSTDWWLWHLHPDDRERVLAFRRSVPEHDGPVRAEYRVVGWDGTVVWIGEIARVVSHDGRPQVVQGLMEDVTKRREAEEQVKFLAYHDTLTGLSNRVMFEEHLELAMARARRNGAAVAVLYVDLDGLKRVNDTLGHQAGDHLLATAGSRLRHATRAVDLVARHGGDEFLVMLPDLPRSTKGGDATESATEAEPGEELATATARAIGERICRIVREPVPIGGDQIEVTASVGVSLYPDDAGDIRTLLKHADEAMYASKQKEPGRVRIFGDAP